MASEWNYMRFKVVTKNSNIFRPQHKNCWDSYTRQNQLFRLDWKPIRFRWMNQLQLNCDAAELKASNVCRKRNTHCKISHIFLPFAKVILLAKQLLERELLAHTTWRYRLLHDDANQNSLYPAFATRLCPTMMTESPACLFWAKDVEEELKRQWKRQKRGNRGGASPSTFAHLRIIGDPSFLNPEVDLHLRQYHIIVPVSSCGL